MHKLLIVDDEKNIRLGLKVMIEREFAGRYVIVLVSDGAKALKEMMLNGADIVITDIKMPGLDGIALIQKIQEFTPKPSIIILSGYDDFKYAKEAIKYDVKEYLLKPVIRDELFNAIKNIEEDIQRDEEIAVKLDASNRYIEEFRTSQLNYIFLISDIGEDKIMEICKMLQLESFEQGYYVGLIKQTGMDQDTIKGKQFWARIQILLEEYKVKQSQQVIHFLDKDEHLVIIADCETIFGFLAEQLVERHYQMFSIGVSEKKPGLNKMKAAYNQAKTALKYSLLLTHTVVIGFGTIAIRDHHFQIPEQQIKKIANMLGTDREKEMKISLYNVLDVKKLSRYDISYLEAVSNKINELIFDQVFNLYGEESIQILKLYKKVGNIYNFNSFHDYYHAVESLLLRLNDFVHHIQSTHIGHREINKAIQYMGESFIQKELNMAMVSNYVSLNYSYFSEAFKEYTGDSFVAYLKRLRINKAKELLEQTDNLVYEISDKIGFKNPKQFNHVFRELEGIAPLEYRLKKKQ
jgi:two-component system response regulator YesN